MANHKSAEKRNRQAQASRLRNKMNRTKMKSIIRKLDETVVAGTADEIKEALREATSVIARTASKGTIHKKNASRKISRLTKRVNKTATAA
ncbi:MAG: 30S ribosomal protein S20 [Desulforhopalus sp.]